jgi:two-component system LytT family response regulator
MSGTENYGLVGFPVKDGIRFERKENIVCCQAERNYTKVILSNGDFISSKNIGMVEEILATDFFRCHKSFLINMKCVKVYSRNKHYKILLDNGMEIILSRRKRAEFLDRLNFNNL